MVNEISLKKLLRYACEVYDVDLQFNKLKRTYNKSASMTLTKAPTGAKMTLMGFLCHHGSVNELMNSTHDKKIPLKNFFRKKEYIPKTHGYRDCIKHTSYDQIVNINDAIINHVKDNKLFKKNTIDGLTVVAWDGVEFNETTKPIDKLPEREHKDGIRKYIKYLVAMNVGPRANIILGAKQMLETGKVEAKKGDEKAKTFGETTALIDMIPKMEEKIGQAIDVDVLDALYFTGNVMKTINKAGQYFVIRMTDKTRITYKDAQGLFDRTNPTKTYERYEVITETKVKYSKQAKHKDTKKTTVDIKERDVTEHKLKEKYHVKTEETKKKNSVRTITIYERVIKRYEVWSGEFECDEYGGLVRVVRSIEHYIGPKNEPAVQTLYIVTNMMTHKLNTIIEIMHRRWNIENNGFRKLKQQYKANHIAIGDLNSMNYMFQMIIMAYNLYELYTKFRIRTSEKLTYIQIKKRFENEILTTPDINEWYRAGPLDYALC